MLTLKVDRLEPDMSAIRAAADAVRRGELVIFPIETAYVIAADAQNDEAVEKLHSAADLGPTESLTLLVSGLEDILKAAEYLPDRARDLALKYWPGHVAFIVDKSNDVSDFATGHKETALVMAPEHPVALALLKELRMPLAVTNANLPGNAPPTTALEAIEQVGASVEVVLDAGRSAAGHIPTVVDVSTIPPRIVRLGTVSADEVRDFLGEVEQVA